MTEPTDPLDDWLREANERLLEYLAKHVDVEAALAEVKRRAQREIPGEHPHVG